MKNLNVKATAKNIKSTLADVIILNKYNEDSFEVQIEGTNYKTIVREEKILQLKL